MSGDTSASFNTDGELKDQWINKVVNRADVTASVLEVSELLEDRLLAVLTELGQKYEKELSSAGTALQKDTVRRLNQLDVNDRTNVSILLFP
eukprot:5705309-Amphidinium_carterae.1